MAILFCDVGPGADVVAEVRQVASDRRGKAAPFNPARDLRLQTLAQNSAADRGAPVPKKKAPRKAPRPHLRLDAPDPEQATPVVESSKSEGSAPPPPRDPTTAGSPPKPPKSSKKARSRAKGQKREPSPAASPPNMTRSPWGDDSKIK